MESSSFVSSKVGVNPNSGNHLIDEIKSSSDYNKILNQSNLVSNIPASAVVNDSIKLHQFDDPFRVLEVLTLLIDPPP